jgi:hypothetical protein
VKPFSLCGWCSRVAHTWETVVDTHGGLTTSKTVEMGQQAVVVQCPPPTAQTQTTAVQGHLMPDLLIECSTRGENQVPFTTHVEVRAILLI